MYDQQHYVCYIEKHSEEYTIISFKESLPQG
jgi:hypothetical protein